MGQELSWAEIGERVRLSRTAAGLSQQQLAERVGLERSMVSKLESGDRRIDALELTQLAEALDLPLGHFLGPVPEVVSRRSAPFPDEVDETRATQDAYRTEALLAAWLHDVRQLVDDGLLAPRPVLHHPEPVDDVTRARDAAAWLRATLGYGSEPVPSVIDACAAAGQLVAVLPLPSDGASLVDGDIAVAVVNQALEPGRLRSTVAHELGHMVLGDEMSTDLGVHASRDEREAAIEAFAAEFLLPVKAVRSHAGTECHDEQRAALVRIAAMYRVSWSLALHQAHLAGVVDKGTRQRLKARVPTVAEFRDAVGWQPRPEAVHVPPEVARAVMAAWRGHRVTRERAVEMMRGQISRDDLGAE